jgi:NitT/TauT family transport system substrate-binding protein
LAKGGKHALLVFPGSRPIKLIPRARAELRICPHSGPFGTILSCREPITSSPLAWVVALGGLSLGACSRTAAPQGAGAPTPLAVQADWYAEPEEGGNYQALAKGYYRDAGLDVNVLNGGPGAFPFQKVVSGGADFALGRSDDVILAVSRGLPIEIVCVYMEKDPMSVIVHDGSPVRDFPDLAGRVVMADPTSAWINYLKAQYHIDFGIIPLNYGLGQFLADPGFIIQGFATNEPYYIRQKGVASRTLLIANSGYNPYRVIYGNSAYIRAHPDAVRAFVAATLRGWGEFLHGDASAGEKLIFARNQSMTPEFMAFSMNAMRENGFVDGDPAKGERLGLMTRRRMQEQVDLMVRLKVIQAPIALDRFVTFEFLPPDLAALSR